MKKVVITGIGVISPSGIGKDEFWSNSLKGKSFTTRYDAFPDYSFKSRVKGSVDHFNFKDFDITEEESTRMGRHTQFAVAATDMAMRDSGLVLENENHEKMGVCIGNAIADTPYSEKQFLQLKSMIDKKEEELKEGKLKFIDIVDKNLYQKAMFTPVSTEIAGKYHLNGNVFTMSTGCTSGIDTLGYGLEVIQNGDADIMICGATEAPLAAMTFASFDAINATTQKNEHPEKASSPFDLSRDGFVLGEGCGILILEEYEHAIKRGANIYCEILSFQSCNNAWHMTDLPDDGEDVAKLINKALEEADLVPENVDYISSHGSATVQNDIFETAAYKLALGEHAYKIPLSSYKSMVGHPLGAASAVELVACCLIFKNGQIPPTINLENPDPKCDLDYVPNQYREQEVNVILKDASGFSGIHSVIVLSKNPR